MHRLSREEARRLAVRAQLLSAPRPSSLLEVIEQLTLVQIDPTSAIAPNLDLVLWSRLGSSYEPDDVREAVATQRTLMEFNSYVRPMDDLSLYFADMKTWPSYDSTREWLRVNEPFRRDILALLSESGPVRSE